MIDPIPLKNEPLHQKVYNHLRGLILAGKLQAGEAFGETGLAADLAVSRTPVREALRRLQQDGLIRLAPGGNYQVYAPSRKELEEIYDCRSYLEGMACRRAAEHRTAAHLRQLRKIFGQLERAYRDGDEPRIRALDQEFHEAIVQASGNSVLVHVVGGLRDRLMLARSVVPNPGSNADWVLDQHRRILDAIARRDGRLAEEVMREHIADSRKVGIPAQPGPGD